MDTILQFLISQYGIPGLALAALLFILWKSHKTCDKRLTDLEKKHDDLLIRSENLFVSQIQAHKDMIDDYVELVRNNTSVISNLTSCINVMNDGLKRIEFKQDKDD